MMNNLNSILLEGNFVADPEGSYGILSIVVDEKKHVLRKNSYAASSSSRIPSTNFFPDNTMGMIEDPVSLLHVF